MSLFQTDWEPKRLVRKYPKSKNYLKGLNYAFRLHMLNTKTEVHRDIINAEFGQDLTNCVCRSQGVGTRIKPNSVLL
jgi:hypothetical protein